MNKKMYIALCSNFNRPKEKDHYELLEEMFKEEDEVYMEEAVKIIVSEDKYFPSVARIKEVLNKLHDEPITEDIKLKKYAKSGIIPKWLGKGKKDLSFEELKEYQTELEIKLENEPQLSDEELQELQDEIESLIEN